MHRSGLPTAVIALFVTVDSRGEAPGGSAKFVKEKKMKIKTITATVKRTIQTDSYESSSVEITEVVELSDDDEPEDVRKETYANVTKMVKRAIDNEFKKYLNSNKERKAAKKEAGV